MYINRTLPQDVSLTVSAEKPALRQQEKLLFIIVAVVVALGGGFMAYRATTGYQTERVEQPDQKTTPAPGVMQPNPKPPGPQQK